MFYIFLLFWRNNDENLKQVHPMHKRKSLTDLYFCFCSFFIICVVTIIIVSIGVRRWCTHSVLRCWREWRFLTCSKSCNRLKYKAFVVFIKSVLYWSFINKEINWEWNGMIQRLFFHYRMLSYPPPRLWGHMALYPVKGRLVFWKSSLGDFIRSNKKTQKSG